jgi:hypothetical protein
VKLNYVVEFDSLRGYGLKHGSEDCETTFCGKKVTPRWFSTSGDVRITEVTCVACNKKYFKKKHTDSLYERLPSKIDGKHECQVLDSNGNCCGNLAVFQVDGFLNPEIYAYDCRWVMFCVCKKHYNTNKALFEATRPSGG